MGRWWFIFERKMERPRGIERYFPFIGIIFSLERDLDGNIGNYGGSQSVSQSVYYA